MLDLDEICEICNLHRLKMLKTLKMQTLNILIKYYTNPYKKSYADPFQKYLSQKNAERELKLRQLKSTKYSNKHNDVINFTKALLISKQTQEQWLHIQKVLTKKFKRFSQSIRLFSNFRKYFYDKEVDAFISEIQNT